MASVSLEWKTGDKPRDVIDDFDTLGGKTKNLTVEASKDTASAVRRHAKANAPVDTGRLRSSIKSTVNVQGPLIRGAIGSNVKYAPYMEYGTRPHKIGYGLRFKWPDAPPSEKAYFISIGSWPYVMYDTVSHPGTEPTFFLSRAVESQRVWYVRRLRRAVNKAIRKSGGD